jgi:hypothetical protein
MLYHESKRQSVGEDFSQRPLPSQPAINNQPLLRALWHTLKQQLHQPDGYRLSLKSANAAQPTAES